ncbi:MAG: hypothetical protein JKY37_14785 [Nannocystaceae bacterium]|nr:hypothetical protein [Nannocystaceae bacterium]
MTNVAVGKDVFAVCSKCKDEWHVIVSMVSGKITKVQCKVCMAYHRYKVPEGETRVDGAAVVRRTVGAKKRSSSTTQSVGTPVIEADLSRPVRSYAMSETYTPGDRVDHPKFGHGVVEATPVPGKMTVHFPSGRKTLAHGRPRT